MRNVPRDHETGWNPSANSPPASRPSTNGLYRNIPLILQFGSRDAHHIEHTRDGLSVYAFPVP